MPCYGIEFVSPAIVEGREYRPFSVHNPDCSILKRGDGQRKLFRKLDTAVSWAVECFGTDYKKVVRIFEN